MDAKSTLRVIVRLSGGLGNQLFQYAMARRLSLKHGAVLELDCGAFESDTKRRFELHAFAYPSQLVIRSIQMETRGLFRRRWAEPLETIREKHFHFDADAFSAPLHKSVHVTGYWQTEKYFKDVESHIRQDLAFVEVPDDANQRMLDKITSSRAISVHFRRGDYVSEKHTADYHGVPPEAYYSRAIAWIAERVSGSECFIFSDDPHWIKQHVNIQLPMTVVDINSPLKPAADLRLMAACRHHVLANSTFSWWGAWLNPRTDKLVVAPNRWFLGAPSDPKDLLPAGWRGLDA